MNINITHVDIKFNIKFNIQFNIKIYLGKNIKNINIICMVDNIDINIIYPNENINITIIILVKDINKIITIMISLATKTIKMAAKPKWTKNLMKAHRFLSSTLLWVSIQSLCLLK